MWKALLMAAFGLFLGCMGIDNMTASYRFTFGILELSDGVGLVPVVMGLFGISEVMLNVEQSMERTIFQAKLNKLFPNRKDWAASLGPITRGTILGFFLGVLPGAGAVISSFVSYAVEKKLSKHPNKFGTGMIEGVAGPEAANNAATGGAFIPLLSLGIPTHAVMALLLGAFVIHGVQPGPMFLKEHPDLFWGVVTSMYMGNLMLLILNLPLIGIWVQILRVPYPILFPLILLFCLIGCYSLNNSMTEVLVMVLFGLLGYLFKKFRYEAAPLVLALVLGPMMENSLRQALLMSAGSPLVFFERPISAVLMGTAIVLLVFPIIPRFRKKRSALGG